CGDDEIVGMVVEELRAAIPESGFVFVAFENHFRAISKTVALAEIFGDSAHQKSRLSARRMKNPGEHSGGRSFAVRAADDDGMFAGKKNLLEDFRHGAIRNLAFKRFFKFGIAAGNDVANDDEIRPRREVRSIEAVFVGDAERIKERGGRGI